MKEFSDSIVFLNKDELFLLSLSAKPIDSVNSSDNPLGKTVTRLLNNDNMAIMLNRVAREIDKLQYDGEFKCNL